MFKVISALGGLAMLPLVGRYFGRLWDEPHYQYFPILLGVIAFLGWSRWSEAPVAVRPLRQRLVLLTGLLAILVLTVAILYQVPILAMLAMTLGLAVFGLVLARYRKVENLFGIWCLVLLLIRPPWGYDEKLMGWLQDLATVVSSRLLDLFGCFHLTEGNVLTFPGKTFFVDEACSGVISLRTILAASAVIVVLRNRPLLHAVLLILVGLFWAGMMNVVRIGLIAAAHLKFGVDLSEGWQHEVTGLVVFVMATGGVLSTDGLLQFLLDPLDGKRQFPGSRLGLWWNKMVGWGDLSLKQGDFDAGEGAPTAELGKWTTRFGWTSAGVLGVLVALQFSVFFVDRGKSGEIRTAGLDPETVLGREAFEPSEESWKVVDFEVKSRSSRSVWGENSLVWTLDFDGLKVVMSVDYYFNKWHELTVCYRAAGWQLGGREVQPSNEESAWQTVVGRCHRPTSRERGLMLFDLFRVTGEVLEPVESVLAADWKERFSLRNLAVFKQHFSEGAYHDVVQVQAFVVSGGELNGDVLGAIRGEYERFRGRIYSAMLGGKDE